MQQPFKMPGRPLVQAGGVRPQRQTGGHPAAFDAVAQDIDRRPEGDFRIGHGGVGHEGVGWAGHVHGLYHESHA